MAIIQNKYPCSVSSAPNEGVISEVIEEWLAVQRLWLYLQPIFDSDDIRLVVVRLIFFENADFFEILKIENYSTFVESYLTVYRFSLQYSD